MFARQVDPFQRYNEAFSAAEKCHRELAEQENGQEQIPSNMTEGRRKKRSLHFEPEFIASLDSTLQERPILSRPHPTKKLRMTDDTIRPLHFNQTQSTPSSRSSTDNSTNVIKIAEGPSIIDLSSGEELVALHLGENDHKRRRDSSFEPTPPSDLREVYDVQEDGSLHPILDHAPSLPSPTKRLRLRKSNDSLQCVEENASTVDSYATGVTCSKAQNIRIGQDWYRDSKQDEIAEQETLMSEDEEESPEPRNTASSKADLKALIRYEGPKAVSMSQSIDAIIKTRLESVHPHKFPMEAQGHELVLYQHPATAGCRKEPNLYQKESSVYIEELDDDEVDSEHDPLLTLQEKIMDMDLD
ncbi:hypothetical protein BGZ94_003371 [Podila epigama]|nr:hypothetical protein BGZ94_003371 [Podila epigama]